MNKEMSLIVIKKMLSRGEATFLFCFKQDVYIRCNTSYDLHLLVRIHQREGLQNGVQVIFTQSYY